MDEGLATTTLGAQVGFAALWIVLASCAIKPVVQGEFGRYTINNFAGSDDRRGEHDAGPVRRTPTRATEAALRPRRATARTGRLHGRRRLTSGTTGP